ncbi:AAA family ATPase [Clostridium sp. JN-1]|uniref:AAA family ATPase n=1 Tax=Clostridium sp. JN-1 TaxID=2483110 RepID=UPI000F0B9E2B|nr:AAA family ATPase [Clostridium sp. JN-1]
MKPIILEIEGFNSFRSKQIIDFRKLTQNGLFGIFGPTGSGKSSILDAVIYALYGKIARDSSGFININENKASVKYTFEIGRGSERKTYHIHRVSKKGKDNSYRTSILKLYEVKGSMENLDIICEGKTAVDKKINDIIGLKETDFTRAVVLPQGKFSEFLKTSPRERSEMLERLFALEKYGSKLTEKIRRQAIKNNNELIRIRGELNSYKDISCENLKKLETEVEKLKREEEILHDKKITEEKKHEKYKNIWNLQLELESKLNIKQDYEKNKSLIENKKVRVERAELAALIKPFIDSLEGVEAKFESIGIALDDRQKNFAGVESKVNKLKERYEKVSLLKDNKLPQFNKIEANLCEAIKLKEELRKYEQDVVLLDKEYNLKIKVLSELKMKIEEKKLDLNQNKKLINLKQDEMNELLVTSEERQEVNKALDIQKNIKRVYTELSSLKEENQLKKSSLKDESSNLDKLLKEFTCISKKVNTLNSRLNELDKECPGDNDIVISKFEKYNIRMKAFEANEKKYNNMLEKKRQLNEIELNLERLKVERKKQNEALNGYLNKLSNEKKKFEEAKMHNLAGFIASKLGKNDPCPVCGNIHKIKLAEIIDKDLLENQKKSVEKLEKLCRSMQEGYQKLELDFTKMDVIYKSLQDEVMDLNEIFGEFNLEDERLVLNKLKVEYNELRICIDKWGTQREALIKNIDSEEGKKKSIEIKIAALKETVKNSREVIYKNESILNKDKSIYDDLQREYSKFKIENPKTKYDAIVKKDRERVILEKELKNLRDYIEKYDNLIKIKYDEIQKDDKELSKILVEKNQKHEFIKKQIDKINALSQNRNPEEYILEVKKEVDFIINDEKNIRQLLDGQLDIKCELEKEIVSLSNQKQSLFEDLTTQRKKLNDIMEESKFNSKDEVKNSYIIRDEIIKLKAQIKKYEEEFYKVNNDIKEINMKLDGNKIDEKEWIEVQETVKNLEKELNYKLKNMAAKENERDKMQKDIEKFKQVKAEEDKYLHNKDLLDEIEKLFKANRFVEFVAHGQLKYVTAEASKRLSSITSGKFELRLCKDGQFYIKDNFNGGLLRSTNSLSGGELFLTSLSLALALSSHIQLKGSAPLEFFFLDEGFGTLDDELLDTVMNSLEKLQNENLCVGIISHVKDLRDRVPVKLIVTPSYTGDGSKVRIENS